MPYFDHAASAPVRPEVLRAMGPILAGVPGNPSSRHEAGRQAAALLDWARHRVAAALGARDGEVVFTSGGTESDNTAVKGVALARPRGRRIVTSPTEHPAVLESCRWLARVAGFEVVLLPVDGTGRVHPEDVRAAVDADTTLVTVALADNEIGTINPIAEIAAVAHESGVTVHTDAVQAVGAVPLSFAALGVDAMSVAGHKLGAPVGVGALLVKRSLPLEPLLSGGGQQDGRRSGTEDVAAAVGFAVALDAAVDGLAERAATLATRRDTLRAEVESRIPTAVLTGHPSERLPGHLSWCFPGVNGEALLLRLDEHGVQVSSGSACAVGRDEPSEALLAIGIDPDLARTAVRVTFDASTTDDELAALADELVAAVAAVRSLAT